MTMKHEHTHEKTRIKKDSPTIARPSSDSPMYSYVNSFFSPYVSLFPVSVLLFAILLLAVQAQVVVEPSDVSHPHTVPIDKMILQTIGVKTSLGAKRIVHLMHLLL